MWFNFYSIVYLLSACIFFLFANGAVDLKNTQKSIDKIQLPLSAPDTTEALDSLNWPNPLECCDLDFSNKSKGNYTGPDDGKVSFWKENNWQWERKDSYKVWSGGAMMSISNQTHKILAWRKNYSYQWNRRSEIHFPDKSVLTRWWNEYWKEWMYLYEYKNKTLLLVKNKIWLPETKSYGLYQTHYKESYQKYVDLFFNSDSFKRLRNVLKKDLHSESIYSVPVLFFESLDEYSGFLQEKKSPKEGGRGNAAFVALCCKTTYDKTLNRISDIEQSKKTERFDLMLHEMAHSIIAHGCYSKPGIDGTTQIYPGIVFNEGIAEWTVSTVNPAYRPSLFKKNYRNLKNTKFPKDFSSMNRDDARVRYGYAPMFWFWYYIEQKYGREFLRKYHEKICSIGPGKEKLLDLEGIEREKLEDKLSEKAFHLIFKKSRESLFEEMKKHYIQEQKKYEALYVEWTTGID
ncbi:MAG: hypothetical protein H7A25_00960 [Leptospiraceae bacterium]|nr:hypothetical protein [Leptospiraceae bacterium]MCP5498445.1 hypothetical protein [Leptospiraceae bacterium]